jgi:DNA-directed RNA polymerase subunit N (RpoN/RPB10)
MASLFPVVCYSCGQVVGDKIKEYIRLTQQNKKETGKEKKIEVLDKLGIDCTCCREKYLTNIQETNQVIFSYNIQD